MLLIDCVVSKSVILGSNLKSTSKYQNRLRFEKSPYLLQHADNPVDWYPWGEEAFKKAEKEDKPIFLSIGYSTCHWCHVMEHESFEDEEVARLMNELFVSIKVDREERPDIDNLYMTVCQMMTGGGGWPLTIIMTPDKKPFYAATYIPKTDRFGRTGMVNLIPRVRDLWENRHDEILGSANKVADFLKNSTKVKPGEKLDKSTLKSAYTELLKRFDKNNGGFGNAPKFPTPHNLLFLLRYWKRYNDEMALEMVEKTLKAMRNGGIYDHIGFGFHRYSTDSGWLVPHFEKMLYDQALLAIAYIEAFQATKRKEYKETAQEILTYVLRDMTSKAGGFYSAEDADSEGVEGKFYLWTIEEIESVLDKRETELATKVFNLNVSGNFKEQAGHTKADSNIFHIKKSVGEIANEIDMPEKEIKSMLETIRLKLFKEREKRVHPLKDDKILTDWNGLMIVAFAKGAQVFEEPEYIKAAREAVDFILKNMRIDNGRLLHRYRDGEARIRATLDDYAFFIWGLIELYETTFGTSYLKAASELNKDLIEHFWDKINGGFYLIADDGEDLLARQKDIYDGAVPSGNSVAMLNLIRLGHMTADHELEEHAERIGKAFSVNVNNSPSAHTLLMVSLDFAAGPSYEVVIAGRSDAEDTKAMLKALRTNFIPNKAVLFHPIEKESPEILKLANFMKYQKGIDGRATAYVCLNYSCKSPTTDIEKMLKLLQ